MTCVLSQNTSNLNKLQQQPEERCKNYTTVDPKQFVIFKIETQSWETKDCKAEAATAAQSRETNVYKGLQGRDGHSSTERTDTS